MASQIAEVSELPAKAESGDACNAGPIPAKTGTEQTECKECVSRLRVLVIDEELPWPLNSGKRIRTWNLLSRLARKHEITLACYAPENAEAISRFSAAGIRVAPVQPVRERKGFWLYARLLFNLASPYPYSVSKHYQRRFARTVGRLLREGKFHLMHCEWTPYARYLMPGSSVPAIISAHNIESRVWERRAEQSRNWLASGFYRLQAFKMARFERSAMRRGSWVTTVSSEDGRQLDSWNVPRHSVVENGVDLKSFVPTAAAISLDELLFVGSLDWQPNQDAVEYFCNDILPLLLRRAPSARLRIVGRRPPEQLVRMASNHPSLELVGEVTDVRPYFSRATVIVVPLRIGGGTRIKILEAMAMAKPVVSTSVGAEGLTVQNGVHLRIADTPAAFAQCIAALLDSTEARAALGRSARRLVEERYSWDKLAGDMEAAWRLAATTIVETPGGGRMPLQ